jgi:hypothetical protein
VNRGQRIEHRSSCFCLRHKGYIVLMEVRIPGVERGSVDFEGGEGGKELGPPIGDSSDDSGITNLESEEDGVEDFVGKTAYEVLT